MGSESSFVSSRLGRLGLMGQIVGGIAANAFSEGVRQGVKGNRPSFEELIVTPENLKRLRDKLSRMRGAALKLGQLLSMDSGQILPQEMASLLEELRADVDHMPLGVVGSELDSAWGVGWNRNFRYFDFTPVAAASIGQVHRATLADGREVAVKIQYPRIAQSIDSDVDNVAALLRLSGLMREVDTLDDILEQAKQQLHQEADYTNERLALSHYAELVSSVDGFVVPGLVDSYCVPNVLVMDFLTGSSIDTLHTESAVVRNRVATQLLELALFELFDWGVVQTDPNFANFQYDKEEEKIQLLDFGAIRYYSPEHRAKIRSLMRASIRGDESQILDQAEQVGYLSGQEDARYRSAVLRLLLLATEPARQTGDYKFSGDQLASRMREVVIDLRLNQKIGTIPPIELLFLHRKLAGLYLLFSRLRALVPVSEIVSRYV